MYMTNDVNKDKNFLIHSTDASSNSCSYCMHILFTSTYFYFYLLTPDSYTSYSPTTSAPTPPTPPTPTPNTNTAIKHHVLLNTYFYF